MAADRTTPRRASAHRPRRTLGQRLLLGLGTVVAVVAFAAAGVVGWTAWQLRSIDREDLALDALIADGPRNYLLVGSDSRAGGDPVDPGAVADHKPLADTIIVVRVDPATRDVAMLSLPRDLWVTHAGTGEEGRINAAYATGHQELVDTIRDELQIPIHHYVEIDFAGFQDVVSAIDGVPVWFDRPMRDGNTGLDVAEPGCTTLDGPGALAFARARHLRYYDEDRGRYVADGTGDLGRISRQQVFVRRVVDRAKDKGLSNPLTLKRLVEVGTSNVTIDQDLSMSDLLTLGERFSSFDSDALRSYTLPATARTTSGGASVLDLDEEAAQPILDLFRDPRAEEPAATVPGPTVPTSEVTLTVLNGSGRSGLAAEAADRMAAEGFVVDHIGNGDELGRTDVARTEVRHGAGGVEEASTVATEVGPGTEIVADPSLDAGEVVLLLGDDYAAEGADAGAATTGVDGGTSTTEAAATTGSTTTSTTAPPPSEPVGVVPGDPPAGQRCG